MGGLRAADGNREGARAGEDCAARAPGAALGGEDRAPSRQPPPSRRRRRRGLLAIKGYDTSTTKLTCYGGAGFDEDVRAEAHRDKLIQLVGLDTLYA
jgi:hypothetical protein